MRFYDTAGNDVVLVHQFLLYDRFAESHPYLRLRERTVHADGHEDRYIPVFDAALLKFIQKNRKYQFSGASSCEVRDDYRDRLSGRDEVLEAATTHRVEDRLFYYAGFGFFAVRPLGMKDAQEVLLMDRDSYLLFPVRYAYIHKLL